MAEPEGVTTAPPDATVEASVLGDEDGERTVDAESGEGEDKPKKKKRRRKKKKEEEGEGEEERAASETGEEGEEEEEDEGDFESELESLTESLSKIVLESPPTIQEVFDPDSFPPSYKDNEKKEQKVIRYCKTFLKQYNHLCNHRSPVFLKPKNEFGVEKMVCTTIVPTQLPFKDLLDYQDIADFVAGYLNYDKLRHPDLLPQTMFAPQTVLERLHGHCFEYSTVLCSMLIGAGYDAFVVSGYATREVANLDLSYTKCPFVEDDEIVHTRPQTLNICRYTVRPSRYFKSVFELRMHKKYEGIAKEERDRLEDQKSKEKELAEAPPPDVYHGYRVHSWVMVLAGHRDIKETFFIEPTTGVAHPKDWPEYLGIETLWNHWNYYINMQQFEIKGIAGLKFDIGDSCDWEYIFPGQDLHITWTPEEIAERKLKLTLQGDACEEEKHLDLPFSWSKPLYITREDYDRKYPTGKRVTRYKYTVVEEYCRYLNPDGLVRKIYRFNDIPCEDLQYTREMYEDRADCLHTRFLHKRTGKIIENFHYGREDYVIEHQYYAHNTGPDGWRLMIFGPGKRADELYERESDFDFMKNYYRDRPDRKIYKETRFGPDGMVLENPKILLPQPKPIVSVTEHYKRNPDVPANKDIAKITFGVGTGVIDIEYHVEDTRIVASTRHFTKPPLWWDDTQILTWSPHLHWCFELRNILKTRVKEEEMSQLVKTYVQADRDEELRSNRLELRAYEMAERQIAKMDILRDFLQSYLFRLGLSKVTNRKQATKIKDDCMQDLKDRLVNQANIIKEGFEKEKKIIERAQQWYHANFTTMSDQEVLDVRTYLIQHMFAAHVLERRFISLKEYAPIKYHELHDTIYKDPRLEQYLI